MYYGKENPHGGDIYGTRIRLDFSANVNPLGAPPEVLQAAKDAVDQSECYPDPYCRELVRAIAAAEGLPERCVFVGNGASELIHAYCMASGPVRALVVSPTFAEYTTALASAGSTVTHHYLKKENGFLPGPDLPEKIRAEKPDVVFLCNPNNPTGRSVPEELLRRTASAAAEAGSRLFVDECFYELSDNGVTLKDSLTDHPNLFLLRAFTKSYGIAGLRLGYCLCADEALLAGMSAHTAAWSVSLPAQKAGVAALSLRDYPARSREKIRIERKRLAEELRSLGMTVYPSDVNFLFFEARPDLQDRLLEQGIAIRSCVNYAGLGPGYFRIAVRRREENGQLIEALRKLE